MTDNSVERRQTRLPGVKLFVRTAHRDERGSFRRIFSQAEYAPAGIDDEFVEDNVSVSQRGVLRGMHYDHRLAKFVQVLAGTIFDVVVDVRRASPTFGKWESFVLTAQGCEQLYVPRGFAHGFYVLSEQAIVSYKQTAPYDPASEGQLLWNDAVVGIAWPLAGEPLLSAKDAAAHGLADVA
jgi:dTDP-4-dehydrorhamnose 3,5-epimerase